MEKLPVNKIIMTKNLACPYCNKVLTAKSFSGGKWQCRKCGKLLDFETYRKFFPKAREMKFPSDLFQEVPK